MLYRKCRKHNLLLPVLKKQFNEEAGYEGATVLDPIRGFYNKPISTLDFASLYPSIMQAHNLCYTTLVRKWVVLESGPTESGGESASRYVPSYGRPTPSGHRVG